MRVMAMKMDMAMLIGAGGTGEPGSVVLTPGEGLETGGGGIALEDGSGRVILETS